MVHNMQRRELLAGLGLIGLAASQSAQAASNPEKLVVLFLRGGADSLSMLPPYLEPAYYTSRPKLALAAPGGNSSTLDLNGQFGLHPALAKLKPLYENNNLAFVQAVGLPFKSRSHFEMQRLMERGSIHSDLASGWLGRHMARTTSYSPLRAVCLGSTAARTLMGSPNVAVLRQLDSYHWFSQLPQEYFQTLESLMTGHASAQNAFTLMETLDSTQPWQQPTTANYPDSRTGNALKQIAQLIKTGVGLETAHVDVHGWDTHQGQDTRLPLLLSDLAQSLAAFHDDLGELMQSTTVIVMTEFGRRVAENANMGTDHGSAGCMILMGAGVQGGQVHGLWPGLENKDLDQGDLRITTDYRQILAEYLQVRRRETNVDSIFPDFDFSSAQGIFTP